MVVSASKYENQWKMLKLDHSNYEYKGMEWNKLKAAQQVQYANGE